MIAILISKQFKFHPIGAYKNPSMQKIKKKKEKKEGCTGGRHVDAVVSLQVIEEEAIAYYNISHHLKGTSISRSSCNKPK